MSILFFVLQELIDVRDLIQESYRLFWSISNRDIDRLRLKHRLLVVQVCVAVVGVLGAGWFVNVTI
jgi:hypothetical protein